MSAASARTTSRRESEADHTIVSFGPICWEAVVDDDGDFTLHPISDGTADYTESFSRMASRASFLEQCEWHIRAHVNPNLETSDTAVVIRRLEAVREALSLRTLSAYLDNELATENNVALWSQAYVLRAVAEILLPLPEDALSAWWKLACADGDAHPIELANAVAATYT